MRNVLLLVYCMLTACSLFGQKKLPVTIADLQLKNCPYEPDATAMKLFDIEETDFDILAYSTSLKTEKRVRIKIFNEKGFKHATIQIPYLSKRGVARIKELNGAIYNLGADGQISVQELEKKDFFKEKAAQYVGVVNFTFPNLKPGSIIEYSYTTVENNLVHISPWLIQDEIPVLFTSKIITTPAETRIYERPFGIDSIAQEIKMIKHDTYRRIAYSMEKISSFRAEPFMSSINDHLIKISFVIFLRGGTYNRNNRASSDIVWKAAGSRLLNSTFFREQVKKTIPGTEKIIDSAKTIASTEDRIGFIYNHVKSRIPEKVEQTTSADDLSDAWTNKTGTSAEINLILLNLLEKSDINCLPVLISTRDNGRINKEFPSMGQMNGLDVLAIDTSQFFLLDASLKYQSYQNPPLNILNREVFILSPDSMQWATITDNRPLLKQSVYVLADMTNDGKIEGSATIQYYDYAKAFKLDTTLSDKNKGEDDFLDKTPLGLRIVSSKKENADNSPQPLMETIEFLYEPQISDDFIYINPQILTERNKSPFIAEKRNTDIDLGCNQMFVLSMEIHFPPGYVVEHLPKNTTVRAPDSSFYYNIIYSSDNENIYISQTFEVKRSIFSKEEYPGIQDFFKRMHTLMKEEIILKKKK